MAMQRRAFMQMVGLTILVGIIPPQCQDELQQIKDDLEAKPPWKPKPLNEVQLRFQKALRNA